MTQFKLVFCYRTTSNFQKQAIIAHSEKQKTGYLQNFRNVNSTSMPCVILIWISFTFQLHLVALNFPLTGNMRGISGVDLQCHQQAQEANLQGTFRAFLSGDTQSLMSVVKRTDRNLPLVNLKGQLLAKSWNSLFTKHGNSDFNPMEYPIYAFNGVNVMTNPTWTYKAVWHGLAFQINHSKIRDCENWRKASKYLRGQASIPLKGIFLLETSWRCSDLLIVLCVENSFGVST
uniref:Collagenase NC10/endostatin domain-containing protein n=1 Tax=Naja naja TaxID=35670 RepID=A0A8C6Y4Y3_NAJNA